MQGRVHEPGSTATELPPLDRAYEIDFRLLSDRLAEIPDDVNGVLRLFDGRRTLAQVLAEADRQGLGAVEIVAKLWSEEIIRPALHPAPASAHSAPEGDRAPEAAPAGDPEPPQEAEWFRSPAEAEPPRAAATSGAAPGGEAPPRIVRFPAKRKEAPVAAPAPVAPPRTLRVPAPAARRGASPQRRAVGRKAAANGARRRSAAALVVAATLAGVVLWRMVAGRAPATEEGGARTVTTGATSTAPATATSTSSAVTPGQPSQPRDPSSTTPAGQPSWSRAPAPDAASAASGVHRGERGQGSTTPPPSASSR